MSIERSNIVETILHHWIIAVGIEGSVFWMGLAEIFYRFVSTYSMLSTALLELRFRKDERNILIIIFPTQKYNKNRF